MRNNVIQLAYMSYDALVWTPFESDILSHFVFKISWLRTICLKKKYARTTRFCFLFGLFVNMTFLLLDFFTLRVFFLSLIHCLSMILLGLLVSIYLIMYFFKDGRGHGVRLLHGVCWILRLNLGSVTLQMQCQRWQIILTKTIQYLIFT